MCLVERRKILATSSPNPLKGPLRAHIMALWRVVVKGERVQGVGFRERAAHALTRLNPSVKGFARNLKESGEVELTLLFDGDKTSLEDTINGIIKGIAKEMPMVKGAMIDSKKTVLLEDSYTERQIRELERFEVKREDDLHEMVWALQGAGTLFSMATDKIDQLLEFKEEERTMQLASIKCELAHAQDNLGNATNLELICLKNFIPNPLIALEPETLKRFVEFYHDFVEFRETPEDKRNNNLKTMSEKVANMLKKIEELERLKTEGENDK